MISHPNPALRSACGDHRSSGVSMLPEPITPRELAAKLPLARQVLSAPAPDPVITTTVEDFLQRVGRKEWSRCAHGNDGRFVPTAAIPALRQAMPQSAAVRGPQ